MTVFDFTKEDQGDWFGFFNSHIDQSTGEIIYDQPEAGAAEFRIRSMGPFWDERRKGRKKQFQFVLNPNTRAMERVGYYPDLPAEEAEKENNEAWDYAITGMKNAKWKENGPEMECTMENKLKLIEIPAFLRFITRCFQILSNAGIKRQEDSEKN